MATIINNYCLFLLFLIHAVNSAPRSKQATTTYDQKQTGEYNIQLHLKDFQIIAVVGEDSFGSLAGDYDYNYDYSDFTIKPPTNGSTTTKPQLTSVVPNSTIKVNTTLPHFIQSHNIAHKTSSTTPPPSTTSETSITSGKPEIVTSGIISTSNKVPDSSSNLSTSTDSALLEVISPDKNLDIIISNPSQIPVIVQELPLLNGKIVQSDKLNKKVDAVTNVEIISNEGQGVDRHHLPLGEIFHYQKCSHGFTRDKSGRCRKLRRQPQLPLGFTRFANNLASKFKTGSTEESLDDVERGLNY